MPKQSPAPPSRDLRLKLAIVACGIPQRDIARAVGIGVTRLSSIVCGRQASTPDEQRRIAAVIGVPIKSVFPVSHAPRYRGPATFVKKRSLRTPTAGESGDVTAAAARR